MLNKLIKLVCDFLVKRCEKNNRIFYITGGVNGQTVYLVRYIVFKSKYMCVYIHRFLRSDADDPHDHPWNFFTYVISGGYKEIFYNRKRSVKAMFDYSIDAIPYFKSFWTDRENIRLPGSIAYRRATDIHKVVVEKQLELEFTGKISPEDKKIIEQAPYTICIMGKRRREWGFWQRERGYPDGSKFIDWRRYLNIVPGDSRIEGGE